MVTKYPQSLNLLTDKITSTCEVIIVLHIEVFCRNEVKRRKLRLQFTFQQGFFTGGFQLFH